MSSVNIKIEGEGLTYSTSTTIIKASRVIAFLNSSQSTMAEQEGEVSPTASLSPNLSFQQFPKSPRDIIIESGAKTNMQKILVFANYYCKSNNVEEFKQSIIRSYFQKSGESYPRNFSRDMKEAISLNYIYESDTHDSYRITNYGYSLVNSAFHGSKNARNRSRKASLTPKVKKPSVKNLSQGIVDLEVLPRIDGMPFFHDLLTKGDKILWILDFTLKKGIAELSSNDIEYIADKLLNKITARSITALTETNLKKGYLFKNNLGKLKILHEGIQYIEKTKSVNHEGHIQADEGK